MPAKNEHGLTPQQERFAVLVAGGANQSEAFRQAYPRSAQWKQVVVHQRASELASDRKVQVRVSTLQKMAAEKAGLKAEEVLRQLSMLISSDIADICHSDGRVKMPHELDARTRAAVKSFKITKDGIEYTFWDKNSAVDKGMKHLGLFDKDNKQKGGAAAEFLAGLQNATLGVAKPDPEGDDEH